jgi:hypothetical protein
MLSVVLISGAAAVDLTEITKGMDGQIIILRAVNSLVTVISDITKIYLTNDQDFAMQTYDALMLVNVGGDGIEGTVDGVWQEIMRQVWTPET